MGIFDHNVPVVASCLDMQGAKLEHGLYKPPRLYRYVLYLIEAEAGYFAVKKAILFYVNNSFVCNDPEVKVVIGPLNKEKYPKYQKPYGVSKAPPLRHKPTYSTNYTRIERQKFRTKK